jgi:transcriptional regulator of acetoin/glycerol metabolism
MGLGVLGRDPWAHGLRLQTQAMRPGVSAQNSKPHGHTHRTGPAAKPLKDAQTDMIREAVNQARGNVAEAARALGISRATVYRKLGNPKG